MKKILFLLFCAHQIAVSQTLVSDNRKGSFPLVDQNAATIYCDENDYTVVNIATKLLAEDIQRITDKLPSVIHTLTESGEYLVIVGTIGKSALINQLIESGKIDTANLTGQWEAHAIQVVDQPFRKVKKALAIVGSDRRGTAYGVFELTEKIGVSPWYWWADIPVKKSAQLFIKDGAYYYGSPSVKYRGIFINDEDWGLKPWASKTFDPETGDIGPKTYAKVCELLLRLKANYMWPAMHECTAAFNQIPENKLVADSFAIVMGSAHCEPLLFNNATEWDTETMGEWNYQTNKESIYKVLDKRVAENGKFENLYTIAMRGIHDRAMLGSNNMLDKVRLMEKVVDDQRDILVKHIDSNIEEIPQIFIPYKEVLEIYENGVDLPDDITLVWPDDNYGYIKRLSNMEEQKRSGRAGIYYHISYLGVPHEYLWLCTTPPALIYEEMKKAYDTGADRVWVANVGDIKPGEYCTEFFLDLAWNIDMVDYTITNLHLSQWLKDAFGPEYLDELIEIMQTYYRLAFIRKPEYMGWGYIYDYNWHLSKKNTDTEFSFIHYREAEKRIAEYNRISTRVQEIYNELTPELKPAFYQLVYYPVMASALINKTKLFGQENRWYAKQGRAKAAELARLAKICHDSLYTITKTYNQLLEGKWKGMMTVEQGRSAVYHHLPELDTIRLKKGATPAVYVEGSGNKTGINNYNMLPCFDAYYPQSHYIDLYNRGDQPFEWKATADKEWIQLAISDGTVTDEQRIWISVNWDLAPEYTNLTGTVSIQAGGKEMNILVSAFNPEKPERDDLKGLFVEHNGYIIVDPVNFHRKQEDNLVWFAAIPNLGIDGTSMVSVPPTASPYELFDPDQPCLEYDFYTHQTGQFEILTLTLPTFPTNKHTNTRYGVSVDDENLKYGEAGTSEEWKGKWAENVLRNASVNRTVHMIDQPGKHTLKFWVVDPGVVVQKIMIDFGGLKTSYTGPAETRIE